MTLTQKFLYFYFTLWKVAPSLYIYMYPPLLINYHTSLYHNFNDIAYIGELKCIWTKDFFAKPYEIPVAWMIKLPWNSLSSLDLPKSEISGLLEKQIDIHSVCWLLYISKIKYRFSFLFLFILTIQLIRDDDTFS